MHRSPKLRSTGLFSVALTGAVCACGERGEPVAVVQQRVLDALQAADEVGVLVGLRDPEPESLFRDPEGHRWALRNVRESFVAASGSGFSPTRAFDHVPAVAGRLSGAGLESLLHNPNVSFVQLDGAGRGALAVSVPAIGADVASSSYGVTGRGVRVAVLDTGINTNHPDLQSSVFPTQHCFTTGACPPGNASEGTVHFSGCCHRNRGYQYYQGCFMCRFHDCFPC